MAVSAVCVCVCVNILLNRLKIIYKYKDYRKNRYYILHTSVTLSCLVLSPMADSMYILSSSVIVGCAAGLPYARRSHMTYHMMPKTPFYQVTIKSEWMIFYKYILICLFFFAAKAFIASKQIEVRTGLIKTSQDLPCSTRLFIIKMKWARNESQWPARKMLICINKSSDYISAEPE